MEKKIEDYLHLYIGCQFVVKILNTEKYSAPMFFGPDALIASLYHRVSEDKIFPMLLLRPISDLNSEEVFEFAHIHNPKIEWFVDEDENKIIGRENIGVMQHFYYDDGVFFIEEIHNNIFGQQTGGDTSLANITPSEATRLLLSKGFDLFGLIEAGLAIDKTTHP